MKSMSAGPLSLSGDSTPGNSFTGRRLMYWSRPKRRSRRSLRSRMPGATSGWPTAPSRIASNLELGEAVVGECGAGFEVAVAGPIEVGEFELDVLLLGNGLENFYAFG